MSPGRSELWWGVGWTILGCSWNVLWVPGRPPAPTRSALHCTHYPCEHLGKVSQVSPEAHLGVAPEASLGSYNQGFFCVQGPRDEHVSVFRVGGEA